MTVKAESVPVTSTPGDPALEAKVHQAPGAADLALAEAVMAVESADADDEQSNY